jgi:hypothetical protein
MGKVKYDWQDRDYVLRLFGQKEGTAQKGYRNFVEKGIDQGRRPELLGGGLIRSLMRKFPLKNSKGAAVAGRQAGCRPGLRLGC